jgi:prohibitin 1
LEDVSLTHLTFGPEFTRAVEAKQVAQQDAERARFIVEKVNHSIFSYFMFIFILE